MLTHSTRVDTYIGLGSNLAHPHRQFAAALRSLAALPDTSLVSVSSMYRTRPWGVLKRQPMYLNAVARLSTLLPPKTLLTALHGIERAQGRKRRYRFAPRTLDLDILLYGEMRLNRTYLTLPHPRLPLRAFALIPLLEIAPDTLPCRRRYEKALQTLGAARHEVRQIPSPAGNPLVQEKISNPLRSSQLS
ncbi:MAG: 2-amino-4-hydroxy-6-hydroxymethyldihydropteridine diphosphokinase [Burkholderiales bacterium]|jgi:2-amino-4-hydroxy-6-hydroxymethyldihydropteridine diphosphokinase|nr:2-amino-4-hydroxy-6-hydroxymethyldihydropteridine diphosphokinase [Burkholderiales bacterium]